MSLRQAAVKAIADQLDKLMKLPSPPTIVDAPPSQPADYPAMAVLMDRFKTNWSQSWDIEVDADGNPLVGTAITLQRGVGVAGVEGDRYLSKFGTLQGTGRIWVAAAHPPKREEMEEAVLSLFMREGYAPGRLSLPLTNVKVGSFTVPWPWTVVAMVEDTEWKDEMAMVSRIWSFLTFRLDVDILVARNAPIVKQFKIDLMGEQLETNSSGDIVPAA